MSSSAMWRRNRGLFPQQVPVVSWPIGGGGRVDICGLPSQMTAFYGDEWAFAERPCVQEKPMSPLIKLVDWLCLGDYERAKHRGTSDIIASLSRGNTLSQNGDVLTEGDLLAWSKAADKDLAALEKMVRQ